MNNPRKEEKPRRYRVTVCMFGGRTKRQTVKRTERAYSAEDAGYQAKLFYTNGSRIVVVDRVEPWSPKPKTAKSRA